MNRSEGFRRRANSPMRRAHRSLWVLTAISILAAGGLSAAASASPSPTTGLSFALSSVLLVVAGLLAVRVVIALERARGATRPPIAPLATAFPLISRLLGVRHTAGRSGHRPNGR